MSDRRTFHFFASVVGTHSYLGTAYRVKPSKLLDYFDNFRISNDCVVLYRQEDVDKAMASPFINQINETSTAFDGLQRVMEREAGRVNAS
jgi:hypothetical protein